MFYIHQNLLVQIKLLLDRIQGSGKANSWAKQLGATVDSKITRKLTKKRELLQALKQQSENSVSVVRNIHKIRPSKFMFEIILSLVDEIDYIPAFKVREILFNRDGRLQQDMGMPFFTKGQTAAGATHPFFDDDLPQVVEPFLPPLPHEEEGKTYSLVIDLDETLVHYFDMGPESHFLIRPGCFEFLDEMAKYFELVIFTAAMQDYADSVLDQIDRNKCIKYRLYRQHTSPHGPLIAKDLSRIGRDLNRTILLDNVADNFALQTENGIFITTWYDNMNDRELYDLIPLLKGLVEHQVRDVRKTLRSFRDQMLRHIAAGVPNPIGLLAA